MQQSKQTAPTKVQNTFRTSTRMDAAALGYVRNGWRVLPLYTISSGGDCTCGQKDCPLRGKHPCTPNGLKDATRNLRGLMHWWRQDLPANIGIATGRGLLVIDIDPQRGGSLEQFMELYTLPETALARTGSGGWHLYFTCSKALILRNTTDRLARGVNTIGDGSYVVAPPSRHASGDSYSWLNDRLPAPLPTVLLPALLNPRASDLTGSWNALASLEHPTQERSALARTLAQTPAFQPSPLELAAKRTPQELLVPGERRTSSLARVAASLRRLGASNEVLKIALNAFNTIQCEPPLSADELHTVIASLTDKEPVQTPSTPAASDLPHVTTYRVADLLTMDSARQGWIIPGLLPEGLTLLTGRPATGKTWLALELATAVAGGTKALEQYAAQQGEVLYLALEESTLSIASRVRKLVGERPIPHALVLAATWANLSKGGLADLEDWLTSHPTARLVVIDTLAQVRASGKAKDTLFLVNSPLIAALRMLARQYHVAILVNYHLYKLGMTDALEEVSSVAGLTGEIDCTFVVQRERDQPFSKLYISGRDMENQKFTLKF